ncbi:MAG: FliM/FliN family flagellar motor switch protein [SAR324 cluster bacterium]|nr:FliM/FliN family flagellar motor switch protein [SAR324 cluster bacterium]
MIVGENSSVESYSLVESQVDTGRFAWMDIVIRRWGHLLETTLFEKLGVMFEVSAAPVEWMKFEQFCTDITKQQPIYVFETELYGRGMLVVDNKFAHACLDETAKERLCNQPEKFPDLQANDSKKLHAILLRLLKDFEKSWRGIAEMHLTLKKITSHLFRAKIMLPFERCMVVKLFLTGHGFSSSLMLCFPYLTMDGIAQKQDKKKTLPPEALNHYFANIKKRFEEMLKEREYEVSVELGAATLNMDQGNPSIQIGQILPLQSTVGKELVIKINGAPVLTGEIGQSVDRYAVRILGEYEEKREQYRNRPRPFTGVNWPKA